jgi:hypothetical protein
MSLVSNHSNTRSKQAPRVSIVARFVSTTLANCSTLVELLPTLNAISNVDELCDVLFQSCKRHIVGNRQDRYEPRVLKRRDINLCKNHDATINPVRHET